LTVSVAPCSAAVSVFPGAVSYSDTHSRVSLQLNARNAKNVTELT